MNTLRMQSSMINRENTNASIPARDWDANRIRTSAANRITLAIRSHIFRTANRIVRITGMVSAA